MTLEQIRNYLVQTKTQSKQNPLYQTVSSTLDYLKGLVINLATQVTGQLSFANLQTLPPGTLLGRRNSIDGTPEKITLGTGMAMSSAGVLSSTGGGGGGGTVTTSGSPVAGELAKFSAPTVITNGDLTGDVTTAGALATTLAASGVAAGTYGDASDIPIVTVDAKGRVTVASTTPLSAGNIAGGFAYGGDGSDGAAHFDGTATVLGMAPISHVYTLTRDIVCTTVLIDAIATIVTANWAIFCTSTFTNNGNVNNDGPIGANGNNGISSTGATGGGGQGLVGSATGHYARPSLSLGGGNGGSGGTAAGTQAAAATNGASNVGNAVDANNTGGNAGAAGGKGGDGVSGTGGIARAGGTAAANTPAQVTGHTAMAAQYGTYIAAGTQSIAIYRTSPNDNGGSAGGSGGGGDTTNAGGGGGGGGSQGGWAGYIGIFAKSIVNAGTISARGGVGGNGGSGNSPSVGNVGGGGGGGAGSGGRGGIIWLVYQILNNTGTITVAGGAAGSVGAAGTAHGTGTNNAAAGGAGSTGAAGNIIEVVC